MTGKSKAYIVIISICFWGLSIKSLYANELFQDTLKIDTKKEVQDTIPLKDSISVLKIPEPIHSPKRASIYSAVLPGLGQAYNKKYWKIPVIYAGFGAFTYFIGWNNRNYTTARKAYRDLTDDDPETDSYMNLKQITYYNLENPSDLANLKQGLTKSQDYYRRNRDLLIIITFAFYGLNIIDASVDAHFFNFDISDDLTMNLKPGLGQFKGNNIMCLNCTISF